MPFATSKNLTIVGIATILGALATAALAIFDGDPATTVDFTVLLGAISAGITAILAKGAQSTGGTVAETSEAAARVESSGV